MMDELDLIQEAVSNWESLYEVEEVETWELSSGALGESTTVARILLETGKRLFTLRCELSTRWMTG